MPAPFEYRGARVLVTGASSGIGAAFTDALGARGAKLILVARSPEALEQRAVALRSGGIEVEVIAADLTDLADRERLLGRAREIGVDVLVNNAGAGTHGRFVDLPVERELGIIELNSASLVHLSSALLGPMLDRGRGGIINVASTAAFVPTPSMATYGATKAFVLSFSEALSVESRGRGVRILAFCPGAVNTNFGAQMGKPGFSDRYFSSAPVATDVVPVALRAFDAGRSTVVAGLGNRLGAASSRFSPRWLAATVAGHILR